MTVNPNYITHEILPGGTFAGVVPGVGGVSAEVAAHRAVVSSFRPVATPEAGQTLVSKANVGSSIVGDGTVGPYAIKVANPDIDSATATIAAEDTGQVGDASEQTFAFTIKAKPVAPGTVTITPPAPAAAVTDDGSGALTGGGTGTINYATGEVEVTFTGVPGVGAITVAYDYVGLLVVSGSQFVTDNGAGALAGDGTGTVQYVGGQVLVTFTAALAVGDPIEVSYRSAAAPARMDIDGRVRVFEARDAGGRFDAISQVGIKFVFLAFNGAGTTLVEVQLVDSDGVVYTIHSESASPDDFVFQPADPILVPPGWAIQVVSTGALTTAGRATVGVDRGWTGMPYAGE